MKTAICIASGPSLTRQDVEYCRGRGRVYVVKECHHLAPWADVLYAADTDWWHRFKGVPEFAGEKWTVSSEAAKAYGLNLIEYDSQIRWSTKPGIIASNGNSGAQIINMAALDLMAEPGDSRIILLGYDYGYQPGTDKHWWDREHPRESRNSKYTDWLKLLDAAARQMTIPVLNASRMTAITCFPKVNLRDVL